MSHQEPEIGCSHGGVSLFTGPTPTLNFQGGKGLGGGDLISILSHVCGFGDDDDEASFGTVSLTQDVVVEVERLAVFQPLALHRWVCHFTLEHGGLGVSYQQITQRLLDGTPWGQVSTSVSQGNAELAWSGINEQAYLRPSGSRCMSSLQQRICTRPPHPSWR